MRIQGVSTSECPYHQKSDFLSIASVSLIHRIHAATARILKGEGA